jgi:predicted N-formylglutamate amidohydrolase
MSEVERAWIGPDEPPPFESVNPAGRSPILLLCDHASNRLPLRLGDLGLRPGDIEKHIGWDIGAAAVARRLAQALDAPLLLAGYSRLVIDCNRPPGGPGSIVTLSEDIHVPGNRGVTPEEATERADAFFWPYHRAIAAALDQRAAADRPAVILSVHSFTPVYLGRSRPWQAAVTYHVERRLADLMIAALRREPGLVVGDNEPYAVTPEGDYAIPVHAEGRGLACALVEIRQDQLLAPEGIARWADRLAAAVEACLPHLEMTPTRPEER